MSDWDTVQNMTDTAKAADTLNQIAQPLGYAITFSAGGGLAGDPTPDHQRFTVHRIDQPVASGPSFSTTEATYTYIDALAKLPVWRLDLDDDSIEFDGPERTIRDKQSGESFCLKGWSLGVTGVAGPGQSAGAYEGAKHLSVRSDEAPTIGRWYKSDVG